MKRKLMVFGKCPTGKNTGKVLLVLMLGLLWRATLAEAALSLYIDGRPFDEKFLGTSPIEEIDLQLYSDNALPWVGYVVVDDYERVWPLGGGMLFDPLTLATAGELGEMQPYEQEGFGRGFRMVTAGAGIEAGVQHQFACVAVGYWYFVSVWDENVGFDAPVDYVGIAAIGPPGPPSWAEADGPYQIGPDETIVLSGWHSFFVSEWHWSIDGVYVGQGDILPISYETFVEDLGLGFGAHDVELRVVRWSELFYDYTTINIIPEPATILLLALGSVLLRRSHHDRP